MDWMLLPFRRYAEFTGRSRRKEYWMFVLFNAIVFAVLSLLVFGVLGAEASMDGLDPANPMGIYGGLLSGAGLILVLYWLVVLIPSIAVGVRRLHDRNMSGWWYLGFVVLSFIPIIGFVASIALLVIMVLPGTVGPNRFGPDPKGGADPEVFA